MNLNVKQIGHLKMDTEVMGGQLKGRYEMKNTEIHWQSILKD